MTTLNLAIRTGLHNADENRSGEMALQGTIIRIADHGNEYHAGFIFEGTEAIGGATITAATLRFVSTSAESGAFVADWYAESNNSPVVYNSTDFNISDRSRTAATCKGDGSDFGSWGAAGSVETFSGPSPSISGILQELADSYIPVDVNLMLIYTSGSGGRQLAGESHSTYTEPELDIDFSPPTSPYLLPRVVPYRSFQSKTTHDVSMPDEVLADELLVMLFTSVDVPTITTPTGWTLLDDGNLDTNRGKGAVFAKVADGTEGGTRVDVVTSSSEMTTAQVFRITNWFEDLAGVEDAQAATTIGETPDPPSITPSWGGYNTLYIAYYHAADGQPVWLSDPIGYKHIGNSTSIGSAPNIASTASAVRMASSATEDPNAFTILNNQSYIAGIIAIRPAISGITQRSYPRGYLRGVLRGVV